MTANKNIIYFKKNQKDIFYKSLNYKNIYLINAVSGCGKTTFVLKFLEDYKFKYRYITLLQEDSDPINFFLKISKNFKNLQLPVLTADFLQNINAFAKNYFNNLVQNGFNFLVLDDFHNIKSREYTLKIIDNLITSFANSNKKVIIISKEDLEIPYFNWEIENKILRIDTNFFRLSKEDIKTFFLNIHHYELSNDELDNILKATNGIIAKILVITDLSKNLKSTYKDIEEKLLNLIGKENLKSLSQVYPFPEIDINVLNAIEDGEKVKESLEILYMENILVNKVDNKYKLHDILQEFLLIKSKHYFKEQYKQFVNKTADILYSLGYITKSIELLEEIKSYEKISQILQKHIIDFIYEGRLYSVSKFLSIIKNTKYIENPLFLFAKGYLLKFEYPEEAIKYFSQALNIFKKLNNTQGEKLVIGELFDLVQFYGEDFEIGGKYLKRAEELIKNTTNFSKADIRLIAYMGIIYLLYEGNVEKSYYYFHLLNKIISQFSSNYPVFFSYIKLYSAITYSAKGEFEEANEVFNEGCEIYKNSNKNPNDIFMFNFLGSMYEVFIGDFKKAVEKGKEGLNIVNKWKLLKHKEHMISRLVRGLLGIGDVENAKKYLKEVKNLPFRSSFSKGITYQLETQVHLIEKNYDIAEEKAQKAVELFVKVNSKIFEMSTNSLLAVTYIEKGYYKNAENILNEIINWAKETNNAIQEFTSLIHLSYLYLKQNNEKQLKNTLQEALDLSKNKDIKAIFHQYPDIMKTVLYKALELNIEENHVNYLLEYHNLKEYNHYKVKIYTFGKLKVLVDNEEVLNWKGKKTLSLLKTILALGGENIPIDNIIEIIWDENDYAKSKQNFEFTLRKLRKILKDEKKEILKLKNGRLSFNRSFVWIDFWEFEDVCAKLDVEIHKFNKNSKQYENLVLKLKSLYKNKFLYLEEDIFIENVRNHFDEKFKRFAFN